MSQGCNQSPKRGCSIEVFFVKLKAKNVGARCFLYGKHCISRQVGGFCQTSRFTHPYGLVSLYNTLGKRGYSRLKFNVDPNKCYIVVYLC